jgi:hypothetical protein
LAGFLRSYDLRVDDHSPGLPTSENAPTTGAGHGRAQRLSLLSTRLDDAGRPHAARPGAPPTPNSIRKGAPMNEPVLGRLGGPAFDPAVGRAVTPAVDPRSAERGPLRWPIPRRSADRGADELPTYPGHREVGS